METFAINSHGYIAKAEGMVVDIFIHSVPHEKRNIAAHGNFRQATTGDGEAENLTRQVCWLLI